MNDKQLELTAELRKARTWIIAVGIIMFVVDMVMLYGLYADRLPNEIKNRFMLIDVFILAFFSMGAATLIAIIPDRVPTERRGVFSAMGGLGTFVGAIVGLIVASFFVSNLQLGFFVMAGMCSGSARQA